ncbi:IMV membrane protein [Hypsugopox virus]|nr:IMV membrane protein [Hypsugopox virus]
MGPLSIFFIILATVALCIILIQCYTIYENYDNIKEFNALHGALEYSKSTNVISVDRREFDANDQIYDAKEKWRCVKYNNMFVSVSKFGFKSINNSIRKFSDFKDCINYTFSTSTHSDIINPCINDQNSNDCNFLKSIL